MTNDSILANYVSLPLLYRCCFMLLPSTSYRFTLSSSVGQTSAAFPALSALPPASREPKRRPTTNCHAYLPTCFFIVMLGDICVSYKGFFMSLYNYIIYNIIYYVLYMGTGLNCSPTSWSRWKSCALQFLLCLQSGSWPRLAIGLSLKAATGPRLSVCRVHFKLRLFGRDLLTSASASDPSRLKAAARRLISTSSVGVKGPHAIQGASRKQKSTTCWDSSAISSIS